MRKAGILVNSIGYGGNERSAVNIAKAVSGMREVCVIIQENCGNHYGYDGIVCSLNTPCAVSLLGKALNSLRRIIRLKKIIKKDRIDTLFIILPVTNPINYIHYACRKIVSCRHCGDLMANTDKYIRMAETSDLIVCNSRQESEYLIQAAPHLRDKVRTIYNILDIDQIHRLCEVPPDSAIEAFMEGRRCIISSGRLVDQKGLNNLLKAFSILAEEDSDIRLILIGEGELREKIEQLVYDLHLHNKVLLPGFQDNPFRYIARADVFALSSFYEGFPNSLVEAMACGTPVVACDCPSGPAEILCVDSSKGLAVGQGGVIVPPFEKAASTWDATDIREEHHAFADALKVVISDKSVRWRLTASAAERVQDFSAEKIRNAWNEIL